MSCLVLSCPFLSYPTCQAAAYPLPQGPKAPRLISDYGGSIRREPAIRFCDCASLCLPWPPSPLDSTTTMERSRTGCATCRKRKRKCDETRPACRACTARGVECGGYNLELRWGNAVASRGHLAGATTPVRPPTNSSSSSSSIRASSASRRPPSYEHTFSHSPQSSLSSSSPSTSPAGAQYSLSPPEEDSSSGGVVVVAQDVEPQVGPLYERCQSMRPCLFLSCPSTPSTPPSLPSLPLVQPFFAILLAHSSRRRP